MTRSSLPSSLDAFLAQRVPQFDEPPDSGWYYDIAQVYSRTPAEVEAAFRAKWTVAHAAVAPAVARSTEPSSPLDTQHPFDRVVAALRGRGCRILPKHDARGRESKRVTCPAHDDRNPSLVVTADGPNVLLHCFGGCPTARVVAALGLKLADLFSAPQQSHAPRHRTPVAKPPAPPTLSAEERLARKRRLTADRTRRWRERRVAEQSVTHQNIRSVTCDAGDACDAPERSSSTSRSVSMGSPSVELGDQSFSREISADVDYYPDLSRERFPTGDDDDWRRR
jgi:hypothetical protein